MKQVDGLSQNIANVNTPGFQANQVFSQFSNQNGSVLVESVSLAKSNGVKATGRPLDVAMLSESFFVVENNGEQAITRNGRFYVDPDGWLMHFSGSRVIGESGYINLPSDNVEIDDSGGIHVDGEFVDSLMSILPTNGDQVTSIGQGLYLNNGESRVVRAETKQGSMNGSSVSSSHDMVKLIEISRHTQSMQKAVLAIDQIANAGINELGKRQ